MWKFTVHVFGTVHKPKIIVHGQWTVPDECPGEKKKKKKNLQNTNAISSISKPHLY